MTPEEAQALRAPFPDSAIGQIPRGNTKLDYVGHAGVTDRLITLDPDWTWEPFATDADGAPLIRYGQKMATMWIRLTVHGVTRIECGSVDVGKLDVEKELVSDALRRAAMRFGVALDLWSKEDLWAQQQPVPEVEAVVAPKRVAPAKKERIDRLIEKVTGLPEAQQVEFTRWKDDQGFPWPWPVKACDAIEIELVKLAAGAAAEPRVVPLELEDVEPF